MSIVNTYKIGEIINNTLYVKDAGILQSGGRKWRAGIFICQFCGNEFKTTVWLIKSGRTKSCGCARHNKDKITHGKTKTKEFDIWRGMINRCNYKTMQSYKYYGGIGIKVCDEWVNSFETFLIDMGERPTPKHTLDRIDPKGDYCKENCRWATRKEQQRNRRGSLFLEYNGKTKPLAEWIEISGLKVGRVRARLRLGWDIEKAFEGKI